VIDMDTVLVVNAGSSSVKFQLFDVTGEGGLQRRIKGQMDGIGTRPNLKAVDAHGAVMVERTFQADDIRDVPAALAASAAWLRDDLRITPLAVGHRVVHGGPDYDRPVLVDGKVLERLERYTSLAPLHQPHNLAPIRSLLANAPGLPQVACFDTAFHRDHAAVADHYAIPLSLHAEGVRRYGFHGLSYEYIAAALLTVAPKVALGRVVVAHLGSGASLCALKGGRSIDSTMGFTALDGLPMGTRPGQIDPGVVLYLLMEKGMSPAQVQTLLYRESGLKGLSGISNDMRELAGNNDPCACFAVDYFVHRVALNVAMLAGALEGLDALVFTAGIGENSPYVRERIVGRLAWLGGYLDAAANATHATLISRPESRFSIHVLPTDEEQMIARHTLSLLQTRTPRNHERLAS
jgi:acetate kinase